MHRDWNGNFLLPEIPPVPQRFIDRIYSEWHLFNNCWETIRPHMPESDRYKIDVIIDNGFEYLEGTPLSELHWYLRDLEFFKNIANDTSDPMHSFHRLSFTRIMKIYADKHDMAPHCDGGRAYGFNYVIDAPKGFILNSYSMDDWENPTHTNFLQTGDWYYLRSDQPHNGVFEEDILLLHVEDWMISGCVKRNIHACDCRFTGHLCKEGFEGDDNNPRSVSTYNFIPTTSLEDK